MANPESRDVDLVTHAVLAVVLVVSVATILIFVVPAMFNRHDTALDMAALALCIGALAFAYLAGRHLWRSYHSTIGED